MQKSLLLCAGDAYHGRVKSDPFVHLHLHTHFSILDGACHISKLIDAVVAQEMPAVAITDHGVLYGTVDFYKAAREQGVKPIIGCEAYITTGNHLERVNDPKGGARTHHLVLLAKNQTGFQNLCHLISLAHLEGYYYKPRIDHEILAKYADGLIGLSACLKGEVTSALATDDVDLALKCAGQYADILGKDNFYLEVHDHGIPEQRRANRHLNALAKRAGLPIVASNDVHYLEKGHAAAHEVLLCMQTQTVLSDPKRMRYQSQEFYLKTRAEMDTIFREFPGSVTRTLEIAERCNLELEFNVPHFPTYKLPAGITPPMRLRELGYEGMRRRYGVQDPAHPRDAREKQVVDRFNMEFAIIERTGFVNYFLVVWDFVRFAHENDIPVGPGRGSGGGSLVAYVLGITAIDPLKYGLIFERFLNPERVSPPDFDIDFCQARRGEVIEYVKNKYGRENVAQIITFGSLGAKTVIRDVGRVLEVPFSECDRLAKMVPEDPKMTLQKALQLSPEFKQAYETEDTCKRILDYGLILEGLYRNPGTHAAGVVIGERPLIEIIPLARDKDNKEIVTQYAMEPLGELGLLKMDFLGLKTLTVIHETLTLIKRFRGETIDLDNLPFDDASTYALLNRGDTVGVFQLESGGMRDLIRRIGIGNVEDLTAMIALYRPGPMNMLDDYVNRKSGKTKVRYDHPLLESILKETYGVMLYQEQVQKSANILAGYSLGEADILRRAMGKKKAEVMEQQRLKFTEGCQKTNKIPLELAGRIFDTMAKFAGYGFNKSHSAGYAIISYQTAYLKARYPAEFMSALISSEIGNFDKLPVFVAEASEMELEVRRPDVNTSGVRFLPEDKAIRYGLAGIKGVGTGAAESIVHARETDGPFKDLIDFITRVDGQLVNKKVLESLVRGGACDAFKSHRARLFQGIDFAMARALQQSRDRKAGQGSLFDLLEAPTAGEETTVELPDAPPWTEPVMLAGEKELLGIYLSGHPLTQHSAILKKYQLSTIAGLAALAPDTVTRVGGIATVINKRLTKKEPPRPMAIMQLEDLTGTVEVIVYPDTYAEFGNRLEAEAPLLVCGALAHENEKTKLFAQEIYPLAEAPRYFCKRVGIHVPTATLKDETLPRIKEILSLHPGQTPVTICLQYPSGEKVFVEIDKRLRVTPDPKLVHNLEQALGENSVFLAVDPTPCKRPRNGRGSGFRGPAAP
ncbi:MAG: DNA polymerase III subunit alpha [Lentisphaerae bacterium]|nr:DNA polymerase III subunit alpha [Lentisphaerota bacterium]